MKQHISERPGGRHTNARTGAVLVGASGSRTDEGRSVAQASRKGVELVLDSAPYEPPDEYYGDAQPKGVKDMPLCTEIRVDGKPCVQRGQPLNGRCLGHQLNGSQKGLLNKNIYNHHKQEAS